MKTIYINDVPIGQASSWMDVQELLLSKAGISFLGKPGAAEGPTKFFVYGSRAISVHERKGRPSENIA